MGKKQKIRGKKLSEEIEHILANPESGDPKLITAAELIKEGDFKTAGAVLKTVKDPKGKEWLKLLSREKSQVQSCMSGCLAIFLIIIALGYIASLGSDKDTPEDVTKTVRATSTPQIITTTRGVLQVPGNAFMDGRDQEANPPLTVMNINIWNSASRSRVVCILQHGAAVKVLEAKWAKDEDRYYLWVKGEGCEGWVSDPFVSPQYYEPVGDQM